MRLEQVKTNIENPLEIIRNNLKENIIGQEDLIESLLIALISGGHILLEGMPGLAKTLSAEMLANSINTSFKRIQFTPDLLPSDLIGTEIFIQNTSSFEFTKGPLFSNIVLADEVNRAPAKVQSALLEAMAEKQITAGKKTYKLPDIFMVIATQNPIEQEGTYNLPEAQLDRFLLHVKLSYPKKEEELKILNLDYNQNKTKPKISQNLEPNIILEMQRKAGEIYIDDKLKNYIVNLVMATREPGKISKKLEQYIKYGVSPRATLALQAAAKSLAFIEGDEYVTPHHIQRVIKNIFRHRISLNYHSFADSVSSDEIIDEILNLVAL